MRVFILGSMVGLLLIGCETRQPVATKPKQLVPSMLPASSVEQVPRQLPASPMRAPWIDTGDTSATRRLISLDGQRWLVRTAALPDSARQLSFPVPADKENHLAAYTEKGADVQYTFQLLGPQGQLRFITQLHKADFARVVYGSLRTVARAAPPVFLAYWSARRALIFETNFVREDTDEGLSILLLLDPVTGKVLHLSPGKEYMGSCDCWPTLTPDGQTLLTGKEILHATGQVFSLAQPQRAVAGTRILSDSTFLVAYEGDNPEQANNAHLVNRNGQVKRRFTFHGTDSGMSGGGYSLAEALLPTTGTQYLWDGAAQLLTLVPVHQPAALRQIPAAQLVPFRAPQRPSERKLAFDYNDMPSSVLYVDTLTQQLRCTIIKTE
ncbi:hypothetical protein [Hymenobacter sp. BT559]|uniref:hypothetical protein n=1 Tax=Hymenobacter sp. BT559 TaxID=2795729 RepID=UPI0018EDFDD7|nr:hypothetical protein [Hymenobacter sp. BT559]